MRLGIIADDFTGASDVANTLARNGLQTMLAFSRCPSAVPAGTDAVVVGLKTRSAPVEFAVARSLDVQAGLAALGAGQILFKICSTFDSTPAGNIGPVTAALLRQMEVEGPILVCPAFPDAGRTVYQGHLFVHDHLLTESGMESHPLNPMTDADIRRWLQGQTSLPVGHLPLSVLRSGGGRAYLDKQAAEGRRLIVVDAIDRSDLEILGGLAAGAPLVVGASGMAAGLAMSHHAVARPAAEATLRPRGPGLVLSGSRSRATVAQIEYYRAKRPALAVDAQAILSGKMNVPLALAFIEANRGLSPLIYSDVGGDFDEAASIALEQFFAAVARLSLDRGVTRLVVAGGETSGAVVDALGITATRVGEEIATGVPALFTVEGPPIGLALKSGNFGSFDFFERALIVLGADAPANGEAT